ncbi:AI-2E family transporter [Flavobacterium sp.]|uniref:AI-2E family transporter n=1 Tax=Flavobacterium sp. TaxID=239 RepID=UPI002FDCA74E
MANQLSNLLQKLALIFLIIIALYFAKNFLVPLCFGGILAMVFLPLCNWLQSKKVSKGLSVLICLTLLLIIISVLLLIIGLKVSELLAGFNVIKQKSIEFINQVQKYIFNNLDISFKEQSQIIEKEQPSYSDVFQVVLSSLISVLSGTILVLIYFTFLLYYRSHIKNFFFKLGNPSQRDEIEFIIHNATKISQKYLFGLTKMIMLLWIMYAIGFSSIGLENALFFAIFCGMLEVVPYVGNITGTTITVLIAFVQGANPPLLIGILIVYAIVQLIQGWLLEPLILGPEVKINPLFTIIALVIGQLLWGIPGIILAIPLLAILKIIFDNVESLKPYGFLIGEIETSKKNK